MNTIQLNKERTLEILSSLSKLGFLTRSQLQRLHNLKSDRNACRVLKNMSKYLNTFRLHENVYYLNKRGREEIGCTNPVTKTMQVNHILMRNDMYIFYGCPDIWRVEKDIVIDKKVYARPDVIFKTDRNYFLEVDHKQSMTENKKKIDKYAKAKETSAFENNYGYFPMLIWLTTTEHRRKQITGYCDKNNLETYVITIDDIR